MNFRIRTFIFIISGILFSCNNSSYNKKNNLKETVENLPLDDSPPSVDSNDFNPESLFGSWILIKIDKKNEKFINNLILNFYEDMSFNRKQDGYFTPRTYWKLSGSKIVVYNPSTSMSLEFAKIVEIKKDTIELFLLNDHTNAVFVKTKKE